MHTIPSNNHVDEALFLYSLAFLSPRKKFETPSHHITLIEVNKMRQLVLWELFRRQIRLQ